VLDGPCSMRKEYDGTFDPPLSRPGRTGDINQEPGVPHSRAPLSMMETETVEVEGGMERGGDEAVMLTYC
jgi:hypothetical protein